MAQEMAAALSAGALTDITGGGVALAGTYLLNISNAGGVSTTVKVAITAGGAPSAQHYIEAGANIPALGVLARWPVPLGTGWKVYVLDPLGICNAQLLGREE